MKSKEIIFQTTYAVTAAGIASTTGDPIQTVTTLGLIFIPALADRLTRDSKNENRSN